MSDSNSLCVLSDKIGSIIYFNYSGTRYKGFLEYADETNERLTIMNVEYADTNELYLGCMEIYKIDFDNNRFFIESIATRKTNRIHEQSYRDQPDDEMEDILNSSNVLILKDSFGYFNNKNTSLEESQILNKKISNSIKNPNVNESSHSENSTNYPASSSSDSQNDKRAYAFIENIDSALSIIDFLMENNQKIGFRTFVYSQNKISLVCLRDKDLVWCFDYLAIKNRSNDNVKLLHEKIEALLINPKIMKIIHNQKTVSELFSIRIKNYIDLDISYKQLYHDQFGRNVLGNSSLKKLIETYTNDFINLKHCENLRWSQRPLDIHQTNVFIKETRHLIDLYEKYLELNKSIKSLYSLANVFEENGQNDLKVCHNETKISENLLHSKIQSIPMDRNKKKSIPLTNTPTLNELMEKTRQVKMNEEKIKSQQKLARDRYKNYNFRPQ